LESSVYKYIKLKLSSRTAPRELGHSSLYTTHKELANRVIKHLGLYTLLVDLISMAYVEHGSLVSLHSVKTLCMVKKYGFRSVLASSRW